MTSAPLEPSFADKDGIIWLDGEFVAWREAKIHLLTSTLHYGSGVFEGLRAYKTPKGGCIFRLKEHTDRLYSSAAVLYMQIPYRREELLQVQREVMRVNDLEEGYLRPICFYGSEEMGLHADKLRVHVGVAAWEWPPYLGAEKRNVGVSLKLVSLRRTQGSVLNEAKATGPYILSTMAVHEAATAGMDEALLLDQHDNIAECSGQNIFIVKDGAIKTPLTDNCLAGITRDSVIQLAQEMGVKVTEEAFGLPELLEADEVMLTGTASEVMPVATVEGKKIGGPSGKGRGEITAELQKRYSDQVRGLRESFPQWLTPIS